MRTIPCLILSESEQKKVASSEVRIVIESATGDECYFTVPKYAVIENRNATDSRIPAKVKLDPEGEEYEDGPLCSVMPKHDLAGAERKRRVWIEKADIEIHEPDPVQ